MSGPHYIADDLPEKADEPVESVDLAGFFDALTAYLSKVVLFEAWLRDHEKEYAT